MDRGMSEGEVTYPKAEGPKSEQVRCEEVRRAVAFIVLAHGNQCISCQRCLRKVFHSDHAMLQPSAGEKFCDPVLFPFWTCPNECERVGEYATRPLVSHDGPTCCLECCQFRKAAIEIPELKKR